uniref:Uncharacterized protein n=1 Tax=Glossina pallidipes TaxID=7398 RepID=A0A1A9ZJF5_GLOPL
MKFSVHINKYEHILALCYHNNKIINFLLYVVVVVIIIVVVNAVRKHAEQSKRNQHFKAIIKHFNGYRKYSGHWIKKRKGNEDEIYDSFNAKILKTDQGSTTAATPVHGESLTSKMYGL